MKICSVIVGIQHYNGVEDVEKDSEVVLVFDEENRYSEDTIVVKNGNGEVIGNIIANLNHPSISDEDIILNNIKNDKMIRKTTTTNCKATIKRITKYVIFIIVDTENIVELNQKGDENMVKTELKDVNVVVELGEPQFAIGSDKIIGYDEFEVCGSCGEPIEAHHKFCSQCGAKVREEITFSKSSNDEDNGDEEMNVEIINGTRVFDEIPFKENYNERISRFEQSDSQRENGECTIVTYYSNGVSFGTSRNFTMKITENNIEYIKSIIPHNQRREEHITELQEQLDDLIAQRGEFDPYWVDLYKHQTDYTTFQTEDGKVYEVVGKGDADIDFPFYNDIPKVSAAGWLLVLAGIILVLLCICVFEIPAQYLDLAICLPVLIPALYICKGNYGLLFKKLRWKDIPTIILCLVGYFIYSMIMGSILLFVFHYPMSGNSGMAAMSFNLINVVGLLIHLMGEELFKILLLLLVMYVIYKLSGNRMLSIYVALIATMFTFGLAHYFSYGGKIAQILLIQGLGSFFDMYAYMKTKNVMASYAMHVIMDMIPFVLSIFYPVSTTISV